MEIEYAAKVIDQKGKVLGTIDHLVRNSWSGEITKFMVRREAPDEDLFLSLEDVSEANKSEVKLKVSLEELLKRQSS
jgi:sporulation protein YlmC with PRC-barrel domain